MEAAETAIQAAQSGRTIPQHTFSGPVEHAIAHIEEAVLHDQPEERQRWYAIKIFERDEKVLEQLKISADTMAHIEKDIKAAEEELDDDAESIITNERYLYISGIMGGVMTRKSTQKLTTSDKIDKVVTNRFAAPAHLRPGDDRGLLGGHGPLRQHADRLGQRQACSATAGTCWASAPPATVRTPTSTGGLNIVNGYIEAQGLDDVAAALDSAAEDYDPSAAVAALAAMSGEWIPPTALPTAWRMRRPWRSPPESATGEDVVAAADVLTSYNCEARPRFLRRLGARHPGAGGGRTERPELR